MEVVVVRVLCQPAVVEGPCEVVHSILFVGHCASHDLGAQVVVQEVVQMALHWERLEQELRAHIEQI